MGQIVEKSGQDKQQKFPLNLGKEIHLEKPVISLATKGHKAFYLD